MADTKITDLTAITGASTASNDVFPIVDVSDTSMASSGTTKKITRQELVTGLTQDPFVLPGNLVLPRTANNGVKIGNVDTNAFGWKDLIGDVTPKPTGSNAPTLATWRGGQTQTYFFAAGDKAFLTYHMPHDWVPGSDLFIHVHWAHNGTAISGSFVGDFYTTFARGFTQAGATGAFQAEVNTTLTVSTPNIATYAQYQHNVSEVQLSAASPTANQIDSDSLEVDSIMLITFVATTIPTITGGSTNRPAIFTIDIHYQTTDGAGATKNKAPNFYT